MRVYIDIENLLSLLQSSSDDKIEDCFRMLQKQCEVFFNFSASDVRSLKDKDEKDLLLKFLTFLEDGKWKNFNRLEESKHLYPIRPVQNSIYNPTDSKDLQAVYLINDTRTVFLKEEGCLLVSPRGEEVKTLSTLIIGDDYQFHKSIYIRDLQNWEETNTFLSPCTDIIFVDRYIFNADDETLQYNVYSLIRQLVSHAKNQKINICFVTDKDYGNYSMDWQKIILKIKEEVKKQTHSEPNVTIVKMPKKDLPNNLREHDRTIFTNYKYIHSGDTLTYFGHQNIITAGRLLTLLSFGNKDNEVIGSLFIKDMQKLVDEVEKISKFFIMGDKKSNFLHFS